MLHKILTSADTLLKMPTASAHCDIPCKIYDPAPALIAALSVIRMLDIMAEAAETGEAGSLTQANTLARCVLRKEEEAEKVKQEVRVIWGDYFKAPQLDAHPGTHDLVHRIMMKASACKQGTKRTDAEELLELVNQFAELFWTTKDIKTHRLKAPYPPALPVVYPLL
jgi:nickel superoxide dismutase